MRYFSMTAYKAQDFIESIRREESVDVNNFVDSKGCGENYPNESIDLLKNLLNKLKEKVSDETFEAHASEIVHKNLFFDSQAFSDPDFWIWLSVDKFYDLIKWRHPESKEGKFNLKNFGIGSTSDNFLYRMWARADIAYDETEKTQDPYYLARKEGQDFYLSFIVRRRYANIRTVAQAFIRFYFVTHSEIAKKKISIDSNQPQQLYRLLGKSIQRLGANILFECMDFDQISNIIINY